jgi:hypothetical protein
MAATAESSGSQEGWVKLPLSERYPGKPSGPVTSSEIV